MKQPGVLPRITIAYIQYERSPVITWYQYLDIYGTVRGAEVENTFKIAFDYCVL